MFTTCSVQLELNRVKSTLRSQTPTAFPLAWFHQHVSRLSFTWKQDLVSTRGQAWSAPLCPRTGHRDCLGTLVVDAAPSQVQVVNTAVPDFSASGSAIAFTPSGPMLFEPRPRLINTAINFRSDPIRLSSAGWRLWPDKLAVAHHAREHDRAMHAAR